MKNKSQKPVKDATTQTTKKGPHGGGNKYQQMKLGAGFMVHDNKPGHSQKKNVK